MASKSRSNHRPNPEITSQASASSAPFKLLSCLRPIGRPKGLVQSAVSFHKKVNVKRIQKRTTKTFKTSTNIKKKTKKSTTTIVETSESTTTTATTTTNSEFQGDDDTDLDEESFSSMMD